jgi:hypothetical protein
MIVSDRVALTLDSFGMRIRLGIWKQPQQIICFVSYEQFDRAHLAAPTRDIVWMPLQWS